MLIEKADIVAGVISGIIVTLFFFLLRISVKPRIKVSQFIVRRNRKNLETGEVNEVFQIKFYNASWSSIEDVTIDFYLMNDWYSSDKKSFAAIPIKLNLDSFKFLPGKLKRNKELNDNCVVVTLHGNLDEIWKDKHDWLELHITAYHSLSGFRKVKKRTYKGLKCIEKGKFADGEVFKLDS